MRGNIFHRLLLLLASTCLIWCTGCENSARFSNQPPSGLSITKSKCYIWTEGDVDLTGDATDDDGDPLVYRWSATDGTFDKTEGATVRWRAPSEPGTCTVTLTVTDEIDDKSVSIDIPVGEVFPTLRHQMVLEDAGYPYIVRDLNRVSLPSGMLVTIGPGVTIIIDSAFGGFSVRGELVINGTKDDPVEFFANSCEEGTGLWGGIAFSEADARGSLRNVRILSPKYGIEAVDMAEVTLDSCTIYSASVKGVHVVNSSTATITNCRIENNKIGVYVQNSNVAINSTTLKWNTQVGAEISSNGEFTLSMEGCTISNNGSEGVSLALRASPDIHNCSFYANGRYAVRLEPGYEATDSIQAQNNFWGLANTTETEIAADLYDKNDHEFIGAYIDFTPWLTQPPAVVYRRIAER